MLPGEKTMETETDPFQKTHMKEHPETEVFQNRRATKQAETMPFRDTPAET